MSRAPGRPRPRVRPRAGWLLMALGIAVIAVGFVVAATQRPSPRGLAIGSLVSPPRPVPRIPLVAATGERTSLAHYRGRVVVLAPFLSLCSEHCPITTGAFMQAARRVAAAGLASRVAFIETTVDPWRDTPRRLRAFQRLIGDRRTIMLTGTAAHLEAFWRFFGVWSRRVPEGTPAAIDWWTHRPERFDVEHTDAVLIIDPAGRWRIAVLGMANPSGPLPPALRSLLDAEGLRNLRRPTEPWTVAELLQDVGHVLGTPAGETG